MFSSYLKSSKKKEPQTVAEMLHESIWPYDNANHLRILLEKYPNEINSTHGDDRETLLHRYLHKFYQL